MIPFNEELEKAVIGDTLLRAAVPFDARQLSPIDFHSVVCRILWTTIIELSESGEAIGLFDVQKKLPESYPLTIPELMSFTTGVPARFTGTREVKELKTLTSLRMLQKGFSELSERASAASPEDLIDEADALLTIVRGHRATENGNSKTLKDVFEADVFPRIDKFVSGELVKIPFGWGPLDRSTNGGAGIGELVVLGAKPKSGKSAAMMQIARQQAEQGFGGYVCSREMLNYENAFRLIAQESKFSMNHFRSGLFESFGEQMKEHARQRAHLPIYLDDRSKTVADIRKELNRLEGNDIPITSVFVDYVQLIRGNNPKQNKAEMYEDIIYDLKDLAMERNLVVYANAQFNRDGIDSDRPKMSDFKGSSAIEMAANLILFWTLDAENVHGEFYRNGKMWIEAGRNVAYDEFEIRFYGANAKFEFVER